MILRALFDSWEVVPLNKVWPNGEVILPELIRTGARVFEIGFRMSLPVMVATLFINIGLAIIARTVPQVNVFQLGFILTILVGIVMLGMSLPGLNVVFKNLFLEAIRSSLMMAAATRGG
jgi:flagellar biosynthetic protein FliR